MTRTLRIAARSLSLLLALSAASCSIGGPPPREASGDIEFFDSSAGARLAFDHGDVARAASLYRRALQRARAINGADSIVDAACNLAVCEISLKHYEDADTLLREAEYDASRGASGQGEIRLLRAKVAYLQHRLAESIAFATGVMESKADPKVRYQATVLKGQINCDSGDVVAARRELGIANKLAATLPQPFSPSLRADGLKLQGTIARLEGKSDSAGRDFDEEAELLRASRRFHDMSHALARAAEAYAAAGRPGMSADRSFLAGRSFAAQGDVASAKPLLASSIAAAEKAGDDAAIARAGDLLKQLTAAGGP